MSEISIPAEYHGRFQRAALALLALSFVLRVLLIQTHPYDPDELASSMKAWGESHGLLSYRDYRNYHSPGYSWLIAGWFFEAFGGERDPSFLVGLRYLLQLLSGLTLLCIWRLGDRLHGRGAGAIAALLLAGAWPFLVKGIEIRVEAALLATWLSGLLLFAKSAEREGRARWLGLGLAGLCFGAGAVLKQPAIVLCAGPPLGLLIAGGLPRRRWILESAVFTAGVLSMVGLLLLTLYRQGVLEDAWYQALGGSRAIFSSREVFLDRPWLLSALPLVIAGGAFGRLGLGRGRVLPWTLGVSALLWGLYLGMKAPALYDQNFILVSAMLALSAAGGIVLVAHRWPGRTLAGVAVFGLAIPGTVALAHHRDASAFRSLDNQLRVTRYMLETTGAGDAIYDGHAVYVQRRPGSFFYQHDDDQTTSFLTAEGLDTVFGRDRIGRLIGDLEAREVPMIYADYRVETLTNMSPRLRRYLREHYVWVAGPARYGFASNDAGDWPMAHFGRFLRAGIRRRFAHAESVDLRLNASGRYRVAVEGEARLDGEPLASGERYFDAGARRLQVLGPAQVEIVHLGPAE